MRWRLRSRIQKACELNPCSTAPPLIHRQLLRGHVREWQLSAAAPHEASLSGGRFRAALRRELCHLRQLCGTVPLPSAAALRALSALRLDGRAVDDHVRTLGQLLHVLQRLSISGGRATQHGHQYLRTAGEQYW